MLRNQRAYQFIYDWTKNRCAAAVGAWGGRMVGRAAVGLLGCLKKEQMSENALLQAAVKHLSVRIRRSEHPEDITIPFHRVHSVDHHYESASQQ